MTVGMAYYTGQISTVVWWTVHESGWSNYTIRTTSQWPPVGLKPEKKWRWFDVFLKRSDTIVQREDPERASVPVRRLMHISLVERRRRKRRQWLHEIKKG